MEIKPAIRIAPHAQTRVVLMHAKAIQSMADFYTDLQVGLQIPPYFGRNLDALDEILADLGWIKEPHTLLILYRSELLLKELPLERDALILVLKECNNTALDILFL
jgi:RNAse (barnase) inhibitor barstar